MTGTFRRLSTGRLNTGRLNTGRLNTGRLNTGRLNTGRLSTMRVVVDTIARVVGCVDGFPAELRLLQRRLRRRSRTGPHR
ncbi:hypothetical protein [Actinoplanes rectilineatus]|uniref:hypothetical protein n=1 Tax=Actinoplanes rectilineatus TaxID=113571 RepID=UPI0009F96E82